MAASVRRRGTLDRTRLASPSVKRGRLWGLAGVGGVVAFVAVSCGDDGASSATLPPIVTVSTTSTIVVTTTTVQLYYTVKSGDTLGKIAKGVQVSIDHHIALN